MLGPKAQDWQRWLGMPLIERGLGERPQRLMWFSLGGTVLAVLANAAYHLSLVARQQERWAYLDPFETRFLEGGVESLGGALAIEMMVLLMAVFFVLAPTLSCLTVLRESRERTIDSLLSAPMGPRALHNGLTIESLARLAPVAVGPMLLFVFLGLTGAVALHTMLASVVLLAVGAFALTSLGTMMGVLMRAQVNNQLGGLLVLAALAIGGLLSFVPPAESHEQYLSFLSPVSAILHALYNDPNYLLSNANHSLQWLYEGRWFGLPIEVVSWSALLWSFVGVLSAHISTRRLADPMAPAMTQPMSLAFVAVGMASMAAIFSHALPDADHYGITSQLNPQDTLIIAGMGKEVVIPTVLTLMFSFPLVFMAMLGVLQTGPVRERIRLWRATRPSDPRLSGLGLPLPLFFGVVLATVLFFAITIPMVSAGIPFSVWDVRLGSLVMAPLPYVWGLTGIFGVMMVWSYGSRNTVQHVLAFMGALALGAIAVGYMVVIVDNRSLNFEDFMLGRDGVSRFISYLLMGLFFFGPVFLLLRQLTQRRNFQMRLTQRLDDVAVKAEAATEPFAWPQSQEPTDEHLSLLRQPFAQRAVSWWRNTGPQAESWLKVAPGELLAWEGAPDNSTGADRIDLGRAFKFTASIQPRHGDQRANPLEMLHVTLSQSNGPGASDVTRISFSMPVRATDALAHLPRQDMRTARLGPRDASKVLSAIRWHAEATGSWQA